MMSLPGGEKKFDGIHSRFDTIPESDRRTDSHTKIPYQYKYIIIKIRILNS